MFKIIAAWKVNDFDISLYQDTMNQYYNFAIQVSKNNKTPIEYSHGYDGFAFTSKQIQSVCKYLKSEFDIEYIRYKKIKYLLSETDDFGKTWQNQHVVEIRCLEDYMNKECESLSCPTHDWTYDAIKLTYSDKYGNEYKITPLMTTQINLDDYLNEFGQGSIKNDLISMLEDKTGRKIKSIDFNIAITDILINNVEFEESEAQ